MINSTVNKRKRALVNLFALGILWFIFQGCQDSETPADQKSSTEEIKSEQADLDETAQEAAKDEPQETAKISVKGSL